MMKSFPATITLLVLFTLIGSVLSFKRATHHEEAKPAAEASAPAAASTPATETATETATAPTAAGTTNNAGTPGVDNTNTAGATGNQPASTAAAAKASAPEGDAAAGKEKFAGTCAGCHGATAEGGVGPALKSVTNSWTADQFHTALREGRTPEKTLGSMMPHFTADQVTDAEVANIHAYLQTLN